MYVTWAQVQQFSLWNKQNTYMCVTWAQVQSFSLWNNLNPYMYGTWAQLQRFSILACLKHTAAILDFIMLENLHIPALNYKVKINSLKKNCFLLFGEKQLQWYLVQKGFASLLAAHINQLSEVWEQSRLNNKEKSKELMTWADFLGFVEDFNGQRTAIRCSEVTGILTRDTNIYCYLESLA